MLWHQFLELFAQRSAVIKGTNSATKQEDHSEHSARLSLGAAIDLNLDLRFDLE
jgi:hypothetical protein